MTACACLAPELNRRLRRSYFQTALHGLNWEFRHGTKGSHRVIGAMRAHRGDVSRKSILLYVERQMFESAWYCGNLAGISLLGRQFEKDQDLMHPDRTMLGSGPRRTFTSPPLYFRSLSGTFTPRLSRFCDESTCHSLDDIPPDEVAPKVTNQPETKSDCKSRLTSGRATQPKKSVWQVSKSINHYCLLRH